jgi:ferric-dicitrate binding protein FerR (iron transport regulator)
MKREPHANHPSAKDDAERMHRHLLGALEPEEFHQLEQDLLGSPELRSRFIRAIRTDAALHEESMQVREVAPLNHRRSYWRWSLGIAAGIALMGMVFWNTRTNGTASEGEIATLVDNRNCKWAAGHKVQLENRMSPGIVELASGVALIEFDGGARLALQGPAKLELIDPKTARLHRGSASVRCEEGLYSFSLMTPTSTVIDLGTEFGVAVEADGKSEVHVLDGEVEVATAFQSEQQNTQFLNAGETLILATNGSNQMVSDSTKSWIRDYSTRADREAKSITPKVIARDVFPTDISEAKRFSLGSGWKGAWWQATVGRKGDFRFAPMDPLVKRDGKSGLAMLVGGWVEVRRFLEEPVDPLKTQTIYLAFSLHRMNQTQRDKSGKLSEATVMFRSSKDPTTILGMALSGRNHWVVLEQGAWERSEMPVSGKGPHYVFAKVELDPRRGNRVSMMGFEDIASIPTQEPEHWTFVTRRQLSKIHVPLDMIALQVRQSPFKFGEIVLGNSWHAVADPSSVSK